MKFLKFLLFPSLLFWMSCGLNDDFQEVPMFLEVSKIDFVTTGDQGEATHDIRDVWVSIDGLSRGIFEVRDDKPALIPVLSEDGTVRVEFFAGIRNNGITLSPYLYPFIERLVFEMEFKPGETVPVDIEFAYKENVVFPILDDFETTTLFTKDLDDNPDAFEITNDPQLVEYGDGCGKYCLTPDNALFLQTTDLIYSTEDFNASNVFLEIDFKSDVRFIIGYLGYQNGIRRDEFLFVSKPTDEWTKLYLDLSVDLNGGLVDDYQILLAGVESEVNGTILVDNIKLIYLEN